MSEASSIIHDAADPGQHHFGAVLDDSMKGEIKITVIATGFDRASAQPFAASAPAAATISRAKDAFDSHA